MAETREDGAGGIVIEITDDPITADALVARVADPGAGALVTFLGTVRDEHHGRAVDRLDYAAYGGMAEKEMRKIALSVRERFGALHVVIVHRLGTLEVGEVSIGIALSFPHRKESFDALRTVIDTFKETVPIWKREHFTDGEAVWVEGS